MNNIVNINTEQNWKQYFKEFEYPNTTLINEHNECIVNETIPINYLSVIALENGLTVSFTKNTIQYSIDKRTWKDLVPGETTEPINVGQKLFFRGKSLRNGLNDGIGTFSISKRCNIEGNITSLAWYNLFEENEDIGLSLSGLSGSLYVFKDLFKNNTNIVNVAEDLLPAQTLVNQCYYGMFSGCTSLLNMPKLPATTLANECYRNMFDGCSSLTKIFELPATTLVSGCYKRMFQGCKSLTTTPILHATTLVRECYEGMFCTCTSLVTAPELPATTLEYNCYAYMFASCYSLINAPKLPVTTLVSGCYTGMFYGCTSLTTAPELPATTLINECYKFMFQNCTSLVNAPELPATTLTYACYGQMFMGCTSLVKAPTLPANILVDSCYSNMFRDCTSLQEITMLSTNLSEFTSHTPLGGWMLNVPSGGICYKHPDETALKVSQGNTGLPAGWTIIDYIEPAA